MIAANKNRRNNSCQTAEYVTVNPCVFFSGVMIDHVAAQSISESIQVNALLGEVSICRRLDLKIWTEQT